jgi:hypothetical protein
VKPGAIETALLTLADRLDQPFSSGGDPDSVAMMLAHRARDLFTGYLACTAEDIPAAARLLLRPAVEVNILLRFIREDPEWRTRLWHAESTRVWIGLADQLHHRPLPPEQNLSNLPTLAEIADARRELEALRAEAIEARVTGVPPKGRLIPDVQEQVQILNTVEAWQAYVTAYMPLTLDQHVSQGSFANAAEHRLPDGRVIHGRDGETQFAERLLVSTLFASTPVIVSAWLGLGIEDAADRLRDHAVHLRPDGQSASE